MFQIPETEDQPTQAETEPCIMPHAEVTEVREIVIKPTVLIEERQPIRGLEGAEPTAHGGEVKASVLNRQRLDRQPDDALDSGLEYDLQHWMKLCVCVCFRSVRVEVDGVYLNRDRRCSLRIFPSVDANNEVKHFHLFKMKTKLLAVNVLHLLYE